MVLFVYFFIADDDDASFLLKFVIVADFINKYAEQCGFNEDLDAEL